MPPNPYRDRNLVCHLVGGDQLTVVVLEGGSAEEGLTALESARLGDYALHAWDLARAIDADDTLDPEIVEYLWEALMPLAPFIGDLGIFGEGPSGDVAEDAPLQDRLIDLTGRRA